MSVSVRQALIYHLPEKTPSLAVKSNFPRVGRVTVIIKGTETNKQCPLYVVLFSRINSVKYNRFFSTSIRKQK